MDVFILHTRDIVTGRIDFSKFSEPPSLFISEEELHPA